MSRMKDRWPYNRAMLQAKRRRELREWYNRTFTSERILNGVLVAFFLAMVLMYIFAPWRA